MEHILHIIGYFLIWFSIDHKRDEKSTIKLFTKDWLILFLLIIVAGLLLGA
jgi:hypothetical protein